MTSLIFIGFGGYREISCLVADINNCSLQFKCSGILDDNTELHGRVTDGVPVLGGLDLAKELASNHKFVFGINSFSNRLNKVALLQKMGIRMSDFTNIIHPTVTLGSDVVLGHGVTLFPNVVIGPGTVLGDLCHILPNSVLACDVECGVGVTLASLTCLSQSVKIGHFSHIGHGAHVADLCTIGLGAQIGAKSFVSQNVGDGEFILGNPAKCIKRLDIPTNLLNFNKNQLCLDD